MLLYRIKGTLARGNLTAAELRLPARVRGMLEGMQAATSPLQGIVQVPRARVTARGR